MGAPAYYLLGLFGTVPALRLLVSFEPFEGGEELLDLTQALVRQALQGGDVVEAGVIVGDGEDGVLYLPIRYYWKQESAPS